MVDLSGLPGSELVAKGIADLNAGARTVEALLVAPAAARLRALGVPVRGDVAEPELALYEALCRDDSNDAYGRYNSLRRRLASFLYALEREHEHALRAARAAQDSGTK